MALEAVRDVALGFDQKVARQADDPFIRPAARRGRQFWGGGISNINADDGEIAVVEFPDVRAAPTTNGLGSVFVRVRADAFDKIHAQLLL